MFRWKAVFAQLAIEDQLVAARLGHLRRRSQFIEKEDPLAIDREESWRYPFGAISGNPRQATKVDRIQLNRADIEKLAFQLGCDLGDNLRLSHAAGAPDVQRHTFGDKRMERLIQL